MKYKFNLWKTKEDKPKTSRSMTEDDYKKLDELFAKLSHEFGDHRIIVCPFYIMDAPNIAVFDSSGIQLWQSTSSTIKSLATQYKRDTQSKS